MNDLLRTMMTQTAQVPEGAESFLPVERAPLVERLAAFWPAAERETARDVLGGIARLRQQASVGALDTILASYAPFDPDSDDAALRDAPPDRVALKDGLVERVDAMAGAASFSRLTEAELESILSGGPRRAVVVDVDFGDYEIMRLYVRGDAMQPRRQRTWKRLWLREETVAVPVFRRLLLIVKLKPEAVRLRELMLTGQMSEARARRKLKKVRSVLATGVSDERIYFKLFKNIAKSELEMLFPNVTLRLSYADKVRFGITAGGSTIATLFGFFTHLVTAMANPVALFFAVTGLLGAFIQQIVNFFNTRNRYMLQLAQNLYFHNLASNKSVLTLLLDEAEDEDIKADSLLYAAVATASGETADRDRMKLRIERFLSRDFEMPEEYSFDLGGALTRLRDAELVEIKSDGRLEAKALDAARRMLARRWRKLFDAPDEAAETLAAPDLAGGMAAAAAATAATAEAVTAPSPAAPSMAKTAP